MNQIKVLFCTTTFANAYHGPAVFAQYLQKNVFDQISVTILTPDVSGEEQEINILKLPILDQWILRFLPFLRFGFSFKNYIIRNKLDKKFDVIVFNNAIFGVPLHSFTKGKLIGFINDYSSVQPNIKFGIKNYLRHQLFQYYEKKACKKFDKIVVNSYYLKGLLVSKYRVSEDNILVLYKGIELPDKHYKLRPIEKSKPIKVLFVKSDYKRGGFFDLTCALKILDSYSFVLYAVGFLLNDHQEQRINQIENVQIEILGMQDRNQINTLLLESHLFCVPSHLEALGVANIEAMLLGVPVVSTNAGGIPEVTNNGATAWLAEPNNPKHLAEMINNCIINDELRETKVDKAFKYVSRKFDIKITLDHFESLMVSQL